MIRWGGGIVAMVLATARLASPAPPTDVRTKAQVVATRPPDGKHKYPLELESLVPLGDFDLVVSTHAGRDRGKDIGVWAPGDGGWRRLLRFTNDDPDVGEYAPPVWFRFDGEFFLYVSFVQSGTAAAHEDTLLVAEQTKGGPPRFTKVEIEEPQTWFRPQLRPKERVVKDTSITLENDKLAWEFGIWKPGDPNCCPTAGRARGTFSIRRDDRFDQASRRWLETWRMVVRDGAREPRD